MRSIKSQLILLGLLFIVFGGGVLTQMWYSSRLQSMVDEQMDRAHGVVTRYLTLEDKESRIIGDLRTHIESTNRLTPQTLELEQIRSSIQDWSRNIADWQTAYSDWMERSIFSVPSNDLAIALAKDKKRQAEGYLLAVDACKAGAQSKAGIFVNIEEKYRPPPQKTVVAMFKKIDDEMGKSKIEAKRFLYFTLVAVIIAFCGLVAMSYLVFRDIMRNLRILENGANLISKGDLDCYMNITGPAELNRLATSFNNMRAAVKSRDQQIRLNNQEIKTLNEELKGKLVDRNRQIESQNQKLVTKNKELEEILYTATHDLRTPLISIQGFGEELKLACDELKTEIRGAGASPRAMDILDSDMAQSLNYILNGSKRMDNLLDGLLRLSRMGRASVKPELLEMTHLVKDVTGALNYQIQESKAKIICSETLAPCVGDNAMIEQVFANLISNAIKYRAKNRPCEIRIESTTGPTSVVYDFKDNGMGISKENLAKIFHAFYRENQDVGGEGLGLAIVSRILELHGGRIWVDSKQGEGSCFHVEIPNISPPKNS